MGYKVNTLFTNLVCRTLQIKCVAPRFYYSYLDDSHKHICVKSISNKLSIECIQNVSMLWIELIKEFPFTVIMF